MRRRAGETICILYLPYRAERPDVVTSKIGDVARAKLRSRPRIVSFLGPATGSAAFVVLRDPIQLRSRFQRPHTQASASSGVMAALGWDAPRRLAPGAAAPPALHPIAPYAPPAVPHVFTRCAPVGAELELDYLRVQRRCAVYRAFPTLGWVDVSAVFPGHVAAPALVLLHVLGAPMHLDWGAVGASAALRLPELLTMISLGAMARFADAQEGLGVLGKVYTSTRAHLDVLEVALSRCPDPSPFLLDPLELFILSPFISAAIPPVLAVNAAPAVPAVAGQAFVPPRPPVVAVAGVPGRPAVAAVQARGKRAASEYVPAVPAVPAVQAHPGNAAISAVVAVPARPAVVAVTGRAGAPAGAPAELEWFYLVKLGSRMDETSIFPFLAFLRMGAVAPDRCSQSARAEPNSLIREVADSLRAGTLGYSNVTTLGNAALARHFPAFSLAMDLLPAALRSPSHAFRLGTLRSHAFRLGTLVYDTNAIAKHYSLSDDQCFPVLLSTKKGTDALSLGAHWGEPGKSLVLAARYYRAGGRLPAALADAWSA